MRGAELQPPQAVCPGPHLLGVEVRCFPNSSTQMTLSLIPLVAPNGPWCPHLYSIKAQTGASENSQPSPGVPRAFTHS